MIHPHGFRFHNYGMSPFKFGLMGGLSGMLQGMQESYNNDRAMRAKMQMAQMKAENDRMLKMMQLQANQRTYSVRTQDADGTVRTHTYKNVYDDKTKSWTPQEIGTGAPDKAHGYQFVHGTDANGNPTVISGNKDTGASSVVQQGKLAPSYDAKSGVIFDKHTGKYQQLPDGVGGRNGNSSFLSPKDASDNARAAEKFGTGIAQQYTDGSPEDKAALLKRYGIDPTQGTEAERKIALRDAAADDQKKRLNDASMESAKQHQREMEQKRAAATANAQAAASNVPKATGGEVLYKNNKDGQMYAKDGKGGMVPAVKNSDGTFTVPQQAPDTSSNPTPNDYAQPGDTQVQSDPSQQGPLTGAYGSQTPGSPNNVGENPQTSADEDEQPQEDDEDQEAKDDDDEEQNYQRGLIGRYANYG